MAQNMDLNGHIPRFLQCLAATGLLITAGAGIWLFFTRFVLPAMAEGLGNIIP